MVSDVPAGASMLHLLWRLWGHMTVRRRWQLLVLLFLMLAGAIGEIASLGAVLPFLAALVAPERLFSQPLVQQWAPRIGIDSPAALILPFTVLFVVTALGAAGVRLLALWASTRFSFAVGIDFSIEMYRRTLYQPYHVHVARNSSEVISGVTSKTSAVVTGVVLPFLLLISATIVLVAIVAMSLAIEARVAVWAAAGFGVSYGLVTLLLRRKLAEHSQRMSRSVPELFKTLQEGLGGIRDVILDGTQEVYCDAYHQADRNLRAAQGSLTFISASPRFAMEGLGMALMAVIAYRALVQSGELGVALPVLGTLALGAQRLIPSLQQAYASWTTMVGTKASLRDTLALLDQPMPPEARMARPKPLQLQSSISMAGVRFRYSDDGPWVLDGLHLSITRGDRVGIVGATGSGKSTVVDLLMGLLDPTQGELLVDGEPLAGIRKRAWQGTVAHVPQTVFLADATLAENIALGVARSAIDLDRVRLAARQAQIADFIESCANGYDAKVGERGVRLSGGQRQRIGIARALYKRATVLVFDEATSALDSQTEDAVMDAINGLGPDLTILMIAHRLSTLKNCNQIIEINDGRVAFSGSYERLVSADRRAPDPIAATPS